MECARPWNRRVLGAVVVWAGTTGMTQHCDLVIRGGRVVTGDTDALADVLFRYVRYAREVLSPAKNSLGVPVSGPGRG
jgi:hypothetical protein